MCVEDIYQFFRLPRCFSGKESACQYRSLRRCWFSLWVRKTPWRRAWEPIPVFFLENPVDSSAAGLQSTGSQRVRHD